MIRLGRLGWKGSNYLKDVTGTAGQQRLELEPGIKKVLKRYILLCLTGIFSILNLLIINAPQCIVFVINCKRYFVL